MIKAQIDSLWEQFEDAISAAYKEGHKNNNDDVSCLRDYARDISMNDGLRALVGRETANERQHRRYRPSVSGFSCESAAKLILMEQAATGSELEQMPKGTEFLIFRRTAAEARLIGFLSKAFITPAWIDVVHKIDYSALMKAS